MGDFARKFHEFARLKDDIDAGTARKPRKPYKPRSKKSAKTSECDEDDDGEERVDEVQVKVKRAGASKKRKVAEKATQSEEEAIAQAQEDEEREERRKRKAEKRAKEAARLDAIAVEEKKAALKASKASVSAAAVAAVAVAAAAAEAHRSSVAAAEAEAAGNDYKLAAPSPARSDDPSRDAAVLEAKEKRTLGMSRQGEFETIAVKVLKYEELCELYVKAEDRVRKAASVYLEYKEQNVKAPMNVVEAALAQYAELEKYEAKCEALYSKVKLMCDKKHFSLEAEKDAFEKPKPRGEDDVPACPLGTPECGVSGPLSSALCQPCADTLDLNRSQMEERKLALFNLHHRLARANDKFAYSESIKMTIPYSEEEEDIEDDAEEDDEGSDDDKLVFSFSD